MPDYGLSIKIARVFEKTSANGNRYFIGRMGFAKILIFKSDETGDGGEAVWDILVQEAPQNGNRQKFDRAAKAATQAPAEPPSSADDQPNDAIPF